MSKRLVATWFVMGFLALCVASQAKLAAQPLECPAENSGALMQASNPAYPDATGLALTLTEYGFKVKCIALSLLEGFVPGAKGAALYLTDHGDFDVVFLPKPQTFEAFEIIERQKYGGYEYSFRGNPRKKGRMGGTQRTYFFKHSNQLFIVWDKQAATSLAKVLDSR
jgi:hypothetical protein